MAMAARHVMRPASAGRSSPAKTPTLRVVKPKRKRAPRLAWVAVVAAVLLAFGLSYVALTAAVTAQTYRLSTAAARHGQLLVDDRAVRDRVAELESLGRLEIVAARLKMTAPGKVAVIATPPSTTAGIRPVEGPFAVVTRWLGIR